MANLDDTIADCESKQMTQWTDDLLASFHKAQSALTIAHTISLPIPSDQRSTLQTQNRRHTERHP